MIRSTVNLLSDNDFRAGKAQGKVAHQRQNDGRDSSYGLGVLLPSRLSTWRARL